MLMHFNILLSLIFLFCLVIRMCQQHQSLWKTGVTHKGRVNGVRRKFPSIITLRLPLSKYSPRCKSGFQSLPPALTKNIHLCFWDVRSRHEHTSQYLIGHRVRNCCWDKNSSRSSRFFIQAAFSEDWAALSFNYLFSVNVW